MKQQLAPASRHTDRQTDRAPASPLCTLVREVGGWGGGGVRVPASSSSCICVCVVPGGVKSSSSLRARTGRRKATVGRSVRPSLVGSQPTNSQAGSMRPTGASSRASPNSQSVSHSVSQSACLSCACRSNTAPPASQLASAGSTACLPPLSSSLRLHSSAAQHRALVAAAARSFLPPSRAPPSFPPLRIYACMHEPVPHDRGSAPCSLMCVCLCCCLHWEPQ